MRRFMAPAIAMTLMVALPESAAPPPPAEMVTAARAFLDLLTPELKAKAQLPFESDERMNWYYVPKQREGLPLKSMTEPQRTAAMGLLRTGLSARGYSKAETIRSLEDVLIEMGGSPAVRDRDMYYLTIFGEPSATSTWGWRYEGHHLSQHWTIVNGKALATTPQFFGSNPAEVRVGKLTGTRALAAEEDLGMELLRALTPEQQRTAIVDPKAPNDMLTTNTREAAAQADNGVSYGDLSAPQKAVMDRLLAEYAGAQADPVARERLAKVRAAGIEKVRFAWMGGAEKGQQHYYRVQGPTFLIEFDKTQNEGNHIHAVWRDFKGDFGRDLLADHYKTSAHHQKPHRAAAATRP